MDYFPLFLDLRAKKVLIVGGGVIACRKAKLVVAAHGNLHLVAPHIEPELHQLVEENKGTFIERKFQSQDLDHAILVFVAIDDATTEQEIHKLATARNIPVNVVDNQPLCTFITPAIVERSPLVVAISSGGEAPVAARRLREELEARLPDDYGAMSSFMNSLRPVVKERLPEPQRRSFYERLWDSQAKHLLTQGEEGEKMAHKLALRLLEQETPAGMVWLASAGPGATVHLTLKTLQLMHQADVILHDRLVSPEILAMARRDATMVSVGKPPHRQDDINQMMRDLSRQGKQVLRLKGGDGSIFGRLNEEMDYLHQHKIDYAVSPGITAILAATANAKLSLTDRDLAHGIVFLSLQAKTATKDKQVRQLNPYVAQILRDNAKDDRTLVIYMGVENIDLGVAELLSAGMDTTTPAIVFEKIDSPQQRQLATNLQDLPQLMASSKVVSPSSILIGRIAQMQNR